MNRNRFKKCHTEDRWAGFFANMNMNTTRKPEKSPETIGLLVLNQEHEISMQLLWFDYPFLPCCSVAAISHPECSSPRIKEKVKNEHQKRKKMRATRSASKKGKNTYKQQGEKKRIHLYRIHKSIYAFPGFSSVSICHTM